MTMMSAFEDLQQNTLAAMKCCILRLEYFARVRDKGGEYRHWGQARVYSDTAAKRALDQANQRVLSAVLCAPLQSRLSDARTSGIAGGVPPQAILTDLSVHNVLPVDPLAGSSRHFRSVLLA